MSTTPDSKRESTTEDSSQQITKTQWFGCLTAILVALVIVAMTIAVSVLLRECSAPAEAIVAPSLQPRLLP